MECSVRSGGPRPIACICGVSADIAAVRPSDDGLNVRLRVA